jgi:hypothetical protein
VPVVVVYYLLTLGPVAFVLGLIVWAMRGKDYHG